MYANYQQVDNAYWLWSFQGKILKQQTVDKFCQLLWRPRPPSLLTTQDIKVSPLDICC